MKKRFLLIPAIALPLLATIPAISTGMMHNNTSHNNVKTIAQAIQNDANNYSVTTPSWTHYEVDEELDLRDLKVVYNDPEKGAIDVTSECELSMQDGQQLTQEGEFDITIKHIDFNTSFKIYVEKEPTEVQCDENIQRMGDINVEFKLMSNQECIFTDYDSGEGTLEIPDFVLRNNVKYFIKQIPSRWSDGENDITGLVFKCNHLKKIRYRAFEGTNCLDYYINNKYINSEPNLLKFPEGLEEIDYYAFSGTDYGQHSIKGYSFPSTLKKIGEQAFGDHAPYIDGDNDNGVLEFKSVPEINNDAFYITGAPSHDCKWIYGNTLDVARGVHDKLWGSEDFNSSDDFLIPRLIGDDYYKTTEVKFGDITAKCGLTGDECQIISYVNGKGTFKVLDHIEYDNRTFYIKEIPSNWSNGENDITGLEFADDVSHLKTIANRAFRHTNCLDWYIDHKDKLLQFPEGLEEIGKEAFSSTDCTPWKTVKGYSFPSTLKKIDEYAFGVSAPFINGDSKNGELHFKSIPEMHELAFWNGEIFGDHYCKYIYAPSQEMADELVKIIKDNMSHYFIDNSSDYLIPKVVKNYFETNIKFGDITVACELFDDECELTKYIEGTGTLKIPDYVEHEGRKYYIKEIPSNWSDGENDIEGLEFAKDCTHLRKICDHAFDGTNCLDYYINHKDQLLEFPEGLEEIGDSAFYGTDRGQNSIKGYSFPSTLKKIGNKAFSKAPYIDGDDDNGELHFKSVPEIDKDAFYICGIPTHNCKCIYGSTQEIADQMANFIRNELNDDFDTGSDFLISKVINKSE